MGLIIIRRIAGLPFILVGVTLVLFAVSQIIPSDPVLLLAGENPDPTIHAAISERLGLDQPLPVQYGRYLGRLIQGDFGMSTRFSTPVIDMVIVALPATLTLTVGGTLITILVSLPLGILAATYRNSWIDVTARTLSVFAMSTPAFFVGIVFILVFGHYLDWLPTTGRGSPPDIAHLVLPSVVIGLRYAGTTTRLLRATMIEAFGATYVLSARARGIRERMIALKYVLRNALIPTVTDLGVSMADMLGSLVLVEVIFAWPGIGLLVYQGIIFNDFQLVAGATLAIVFFAIAVNLLVDLLYRYFDPRVRLT